MVYVWWLLPLQLLRPFPLIWLQKDSLMDLSFHVPTSNTQFVGDEHRTSAQVRLLIRTRWQKHMHTWCKSWKCEISLPFRCYGRLYQFKLTVGAPQRLLLLHSMELQFLHQGRKTYIWTSAPLNLMYIIFLTKVSKGSFSIQRSIQCWASSVIFATPRTS